MPNKSTDLSEESTDLSEESTDLSEESTDVKEFSIKIMKKIGGKATSKTKTNIIQLFEKYGYKYTFDRESVCQQFVVSKSRASEIIKNMKKWEIIVKIKNTQYKFVK